jgi:hypothetical protein
MARGRARDTVGEHNELHISDDAPKKSQVKKEKNKSTY